MKIKSFSKNGYTPKNWLKERLGWVVTKTSEVASISSLALTLLQNMK